MKDLFFFFKGQIQTSGLAGQEYMDQITDILLEDDLVKKTRTKDSIDVGRVGDYEAVVIPDTDLDYLISLIRQSYRFHGVG